MTNVQFTAVSCPKCAQPFTERLYATKRHDQDGIHKETVHRHRCVNEGCRHLFDKIVRAPCAPKF